MMRRRSYSRLLPLIGFTLLMSCDDPAAIQEPDPPAVMTHDTKLTYSTRTRSLKSQYEGQLMARFEPDYGILWSESFQVPRDQSFDDLSRHYRVALENTGEWQTIGEGALGLDAADFARAAGWSSGENILIIFSVAPIGDNEPKPVNTLSNLDCAPSARHCSRD